MSQWNLFEILFCIFVLVLQLLERTFRLRLCLFVENIIFPEKMSHHRDSDGDKMGGVVVLVIRWCGGGGDGNGMVVLEVA